MMKFVINLEEIKITQTGLLVLRENKKLTTGTQWKFKNRNNSQSWRRARGQ